MRALLLIALLVWQQPAQPETGTVSGTILYSDGTPVQSMVRFTLVGQAGTPAAGPNYTFTDASGAYSVRLPPGRYLIHVNSANPVYYPGVVDRSSATPVTVTTNSKGEGMSFSLPLSASGVRVQGRLTLPPNYPVPVTQLHVSLAGDSQPGGDGTFQFTHVMPGAYPLSVSAPGSQPLMVTVADRDIAGIDIRVPPLIPLQGTVSLDGTGARPRFSLQIEGLLPPGGPSASLPRGAFRISVTPAGDGTFTAHLPAGEFRVTVNGLPAGYYLRSITSGSSEITGSPLKVASTDAFVRLAVTMGMSSGVRVAGRVLSAGDNASKPLERITLTAVAVADTVEVSLDSDGSFQFPRIQPGTYLARLRGV